MSELMWDGLNLMVMGMSTVFVFLAVLVVGTTLMSRIIMRLPASNEMDHSSVAKGQINREQLAEIAAVAAAVTHVHNR